MTVLATILHTPTLLLALARHFGLDRVVILHHSNVLTDSRWRTMEELCSRLMVEEAMFYCSVMDNGQISPARLADSLVLDLDDAHKMIEASGEYFMFDIHWLVSEEDLVEPPAGLRLDSNFYSISMQEGSADILERYRIKGKPASNFLATWSKDELTIRIPNMWERRKDLRGVSLKTVTDPWSTIVIRESDCCFQGYIPDILRAMTSMSNFTISWEVQKDRIYGSPGPNGTWIGMIGKVWSGEADVVAAFLAVTISRNQACSFTSAFAESLGTLMIVDPAYVKEQNIMNLLAFLQVFTLNGWLITLLSMIAICITCSALLVLSSKHTLKNSVLLSWSFAFDSLIQESTNISPTFLSRKILLITAGLYSIVAMAYYEGMLTSFMTVQLQTVHFKQFSDVLKLEYQVIVNEGTKHVTDLETALPGTGRHKVYHETMKNNPEAFCDSAKACLDYLLQNPKVAYVGSSYNSLGDNRFIVFKKLADATIDHVAFALQKDSEFLRLFNYYLIQLKSVGVLDNIYKKWVDMDQPNNVCGEKNAEKALPLGYENLFMPSLLLMGGMSVALFLMALEYITWRTITFIGESPLYLKRR